MRKLKFYAKTYLGRRSNNEDKYFANKITDDLFFFAIADGMGGSVSGEVASKLVIDKALAVLKEEAQFIASPNELKDILLRIYLISQKAIKDKIAKEPMLTGMGSTLVSLLIYKDTYVYGNLGDSRLYKIDNEKNIKLTEDHTYVQDFLKKNSKALSESILNKYGNYIMKSLDGGSDEPDIFPKDKTFEILNNNSAFLLCSDGLVLDKTSSDDQKIFDFIVSNKKLDKAVDALINQAFEDGSKDNITAIAVEYGMIKREKTDLNKNQTKNTHQHRFRISLMTGTLLFAIFLVTIALTYFILKQYNPFTVSQAQLEKSTSISSPINKNNDVTRDKNDIHSSGNKTNWQPFGGQIDITIDFNGSLEWKEISDAKEYLIEINQDGNKIFSKVTDRTIQELKFLNPGRYNIFMIAEQINSNKSTFKGALNIKAKKLPNKRK